MAKSKTLTTPAMNHEITVTFNNGKVIEFDSVKILKLLGMKDTEVNRRKIYSSGRALLAEKLAAQGKKIKQMVSNRSR